MLTADRTPPAVTMAGKPKNPGAFVSGDPRANKGRGVGSRNQLASRFFKDTYALWEEQGEAVLRRAAFENPLGFAQMIAKLMPAKLEISTPTDGMTDEQLLRMIELAERMAAIGATNARASMTFGGGGDEATRGGGSPHDALSRGEVIEGVLLASPPADPFVIGPPISGDPVGDPPHSTSADVPDRSMGNPIDPDEVDPLSLF